MITGQALVLWSRLHLIVTGKRGDRIIKYTKWMIIIDAICLHIPTTVLTYGSNGDTNRHVFVYGYNIMEKIQMSGFFCQEIILSSIYIIETVKILRTSLQPNTKKTMQQLIFINVVIIIMDLGLLGLEAASLYILETLLKGVIYSIKLKLEFAILGKLVNFVGGRSDSQPRNASVGFMNTDPYHTERKGSTFDRKTSTLDQDMNLDEFVDLSKVNGDVAHPSRVSDSLPSRRKTPRSRGEGMDFEYDFARFEHIEDVSRLRNSSSSISSLADAHVNVCVHGNGCV